MDRGAAWATAGAGILFRPVPLLSRSKTIEIYYDRWGELGLEECNNIVMRRLFVSFMLLCCILIAATGAACGQLTLSCNGFSGSDDRGEPAALKQAPHGAKRIGKHTLQVNWAHGLRRLVDDGCDGDGIGGSCWDYCGYNAALRLHFIGHEDEDLFTGVLLDDTSGRLMPGGGSVIFSPDGKKYLATSQWNGKELADWKLYTRNGTLLWAGDSGIVRMDDVLRVKVAFAEYEVAYWSPSGELCTEYTDPDSKKKIELKLTQGANRKWKWVQQK